MKFLGYIAMVLDLFLGNAHFVYVLYPASTEWYSSDVAMFTRVSLWIAVSCLWTRTYKPETLTVIWYCLCSLWDIYQTIIETNGENPQLEIVIFLVGAVLIHVYYLSNVRATEK